MYKQRPKPRTYRAYLIKIGKIRDTLTPFLNLHNLKTRIKGAASKEDIENANREDYEEWFEEFIAPDLEEYEYNEGARGFSA